MSSLFAGHMLSLAHVFVGVRGTCLRWRSWHLSSLVAGHMLSLAHVFVGVHGTCLRWLQATWYHWHMPSLVTGHLLSLAHVSVGAGGTCLRLRSCHLLSLTHVLVDVRGTCLPWLLATCVIIGTCLRWRSWYKSSLALVTHAIAPSTELIRCHLHADWSSMLLLQWCIVSVSLSCIGSYDFARFDRHMCLFVLSQNSFACSRLVSLATGCVPQMTRFP